MPFPTNTMKENAAIGSVSTATHVALFSTAGGASAGTEISGGGYARRPVTWTHGAADGSTTSGALEFTVGSGTTVAGFGLYTALSGGTYLGGGSLTSQNFSSAGTYTLTVTSSVN